MFLFLICLLCIIFIYFLGKRNHDYWQKKQVKYEKPRLFFGSFLKELADKCSLSERFANLYRQYPDEKYVGYFDWHEQVLLLRDPELIKYVLVTDSRYFHHRGANFGNNYDEPFLKNLFNVDGDIWKQLRYKLTWAFSSAKLKAMFPMIVEQTKKLLTVANTAAELGGEVDVRELMARYTTDFIGACAFGINADTLNEESSTFRNIGKRIFTITKRDIIVTILKILSPNLFRNLHFVAPEVEIQLLSLVKQIFRERNYIPSDKNDFIDVMLELRQKGTIVGESIEKRNADGTPAKVEIKITDELLVAQLFLFFAAGFETSSSASSFLLHMLAYNPEAQAHCQKEVDEVFEKFDGQLCFDAVREMKYLEMALKESLRIFPSPTFLMRKSVSKYTFPDTNLTIDEKTLIVISLEALHSDGKYFDDPEEFRPERFHPNNAATFNKYAYLPFGDGPRACIGERMGMMQSLAGVAAILSKFTVEPTANSLRKPRVDPRSNLTQNIIGGLPLLLKRR